jgi:S-adenosylhomocysteine hydrolase
MLAELLLGGIGSREALQTESRGHLALVLGHGRIGKGEALTAAIASSSVVFSRHHSLALRLGQPAPA